MGVCHTFLFKMNSRDESLPMSPTKTKQFVGATTPTSQNDMVRSDDFRDDGDLSGDEDEDDEEGEEEEEEETEDEEEGAVSWQKNSNPVGSTLGVLAAIKEEDSSDERSPKPKRTERVNPVENAPAEKLTYGYFDYTTSKKQAGAVATPIEETADSASTVAEITTEPLGRPLTTQRVKTPLPERQEQKQDEPFVRPTSPVCMDCIVNGKDHHHGRAPVQSPPPARATFPQPSLGASLKRTSTESIGSSDSTAPSIDPKPENAISGTPNKSLGHPSFSTPQKQPFDGQAPPTPAATPNTTPALRRKGSLPVRELTPSRDLHSQGSFLDITPPRDQASLKLAIPTPPKELQATPSHDRSSPTKKLFNNPGTPARQRVPAIPPTPPTTPARRKSLPHEFSKSYLSLPTPVEEEPPSAIEPAQAQDQEQAQTQTKTQTQTQPQAQTQVQTADEIRKGRGHSRSHSESHSHSHTHSHSHSHGDGDDDNCPFVSRARIFRDMHQTKSYSNKPNVPESSRRLSHSYSASDIHSQRRSSSLPRNPDPSYLGMPYGYSRSTSPELSRLSQSYIQRPGSSDGYRRPGSSDGFRRPGSSDGFRRLGSSDEFRRPGSSDGSRLNYSYLQSRPTTPDVGYGGNRVPFAEGSESGSWMPHPPPPPPSIASSVGTSANSSMLLNPLAPAINFRREIPQRPVSRSISENDLHNIGRFFDSVLTKRAGEPIEESDSPMEEPTPESRVGTVIPDIPKIEITEQKTGDSKTSELDTNVLTVINKYYLRGQNYYNFAFSLLIFFFGLGCCIGVATGFTYFFGDRGLAAALFGPGKILEDLSPYIALSVWLGLFIWITVFSNRAFNPDAEKLRKQGLLAEIIGSRRATTFKRRLNHRWMKMVILLCLITAGTRGLYLGGQIVVPPLVVGINKGVSTGMDYFNTLRTPTIEVATGTETEADTAAQDPWADMDLMYFQSTEDMGAKEASSMEGSQGYSPSADGGYFGDEKEVSWGEVLKMGLAVFAPPMGVGALAWRRGRSQ